MQPARVVGYATATIRHPTLAGRRLVLVQPLAADGQTPDGWPLLALDDVGAAAGDQVMLTSDGRWASDRVGDRTCPVRYTVIGIRDTNGHR